MNRTTLYCPLYTATQWKPRVCDWKSKVGIFVSSIRSHFSRNDCSSPSSPADGGYCKITYLSSLLSKVSQCLRSKNWDTRVAAAHAIGAIAGNVKHTTLTELYSCVETTMSEAGISGIVEDVVAWPNFDSRIGVSSSFRSFDINKVLEFGALLASGGQEYDIASDNMKNPRECLARQKQNLRRQLGLDMCEQFMDVNDMIRDEDLNEHKFNSHGNGVPRQFYTQHSVHNVRQLVSNMVPSYKSRRLSARELNLLKRKAKIS
ncbi:TATA-binding protein-associated factor BTAF1 [Camellia lanceoleosa]|uniref:TATA-binding protein-associated factor BTAF1 n=1 Tax=Camellia lanceoleosa TaxID=1840588 RepID=A0ACC0FLD7_9ERIC|nr:TATA-binding protein-associated factor BTAF1 [Camellia lanceoleosa]